MIKLSEFWATAIGKGAWAILAVSGALISWGMANLVLKTDLEITKTSFAKDISELALRVNKTETNQERLLERMSAMQSDISFIRGSMEKKQGGH